MKMIIWQDVDTNITYRGAWVLDNRSAGSKIFKMEMKNLDMCGKPTWIFCRHPELASLAIAIVEDKVTIEEVKET